jgi:hypothetical protein
MHACAQVATRFLSCFPALYWYLAHTAAAPGCCGAPPTHIALGLVQARQALGAVQVSSLLWAWCFVYTALGCTLFINFLPWT